MLRFASLLLLAISVPVSAQIVVTSASPTTVSVTVYRGDQSGPFDLDDLDGFALITETRTIDLPPGRVTIRFEGVASGIQPVTAIVFGVPVQEKNRDRRLLSQRGLLDAFTGQSVTVRRTDAATGKVTEEPGTIRSAPDRLILQTKDGFESLNCSGLDQTLLFPNVPADLTAKPTLSVTTRDQPGGKQTITLSYLADQFNWQANYIGEFSSDARSVDLHAWITMASNDQTSFVNANVYAVAGNLSRVDEEGGRQREEDNSLYSDDIDIIYECWPRGTTSSDALQRSMRPPPPAPSPVYLMVPSAKADLLELEFVIVTGSRVAVQEELGDFKLYRIPFAVTVAARSQKQVAFLSKPKVKGEIVYRSQFYDEDGNEVEMLYRVKNTKQAGLGTALPSGQVALFQTANERRMLVGETSMTDKAVGEEVELSLGETTNVSIDVEDIRKRADHSREYALTVSNANPFSVVYEAEFRSDEEIRFGKYSARVFERKGWQVWRVTVPANGERKLSFRITTQP